MADYKVGNLQIAFEAIDKTSADFKELAKNLRALQKLITNIGNADITPFVNNIKALRKEMSPLLTKIQGASQGIAEFNSVTKQFGIKSTKALSNVTTDFSNIAQAVTETTNVTKEFNATVNSDKRQLAETQNIIKGIWETFSNDTIKSTLDLQKQEQQILKNKIAFLELKIAERQGMSQEQLREELNKTGITTKQLRQELKKLQAELLNSGNSASKATSGWKKFIKSIGRIALYRTIRRALQLITQSITETIQEFAKVDDNVNNTMSQITSSLQVIKLSFGTAFLPILEAIAPALQQLAQVFANFANTVSASMSKDGTYWAINAQAIQDYREQLEKTSGSLASFDKIQSLSGKSSSSFLEKRNVADLNDELGLTRLNLKGISFMLSGIGGLIASVLYLINKIATASAVQTIIGAIGWVVGGLAKAVGWLIDILDKSGLLTPILWGILGVLTYIGATKIITWLGNGSLIKWLRVVISLMKEDLRGTLKLVGEDIVKVMTSTKALAAGIGALAGSVIYLATSWPELNEKQRVLIPVLSTVIGLIVGLGTAAVLSITAVKEALKLNPAAIAKAAATAFLFTTAAGIAIGTAISTSKNAANAKAFANGGIPSVGTLFYAGEAGAETVTVGSSGRTEVTNVSQMETALYNALVRYGRENRGSDSAININIDGQKVFEATRRVANRKGLDFSRV